MAAVNKPQGMYALGLGLFTSINPWCCTIIIANFRPVDSFSANFCQLFIYFSITRDTVN